MVSVYLFVAAVSAVLVRAAERECARRCGKDGTARGRPALAFIGAQAFNVVWTLALAYLLVGRVRFAAPFK
jgi:hypothetical protein